MENYVNGSEKAWCFTVAGGYGTANDTKLWIPKSIVEIGAPNEYGNANIYIPQWFATKKGIRGQIERIREIDFGTIIEEK